VSRPIEKPTHERVPVGEYKEDRANEGRMQLIEITVTGYWVIGEGVTPHP